MKVLESLNLFVSCASSVCLIVLLISFKSVAAERSGLEAPESLEESCSFEGNLPTNFPATSATERMLPQKVQQDFKNLLELFENPVSLTEWPQRKRAHCQPLKGGIVWRDPSDRWCTECILHGSNWKACFKFYPDLSQHACILQEMIVYLRPPDTKLIENFQNEITPLLGDAKEASGVSEAGSGHWNDVRMWNTPGNEAYLYTYNTHFIGFLWRRSPLKELEKNGYEFLSYRYKKANRELLTVAKKACQEARTSNCNELLPALQELVNLNFEDPKNQLSKKAKEERDDKILLKLEKALDSVSGKLRRTPKNAINYPLYVYWQQLLARAAGRLQSSKNWPKLELKLKNEGLIYERVHGPWAMLILAGLKDLAIHYQNSFWGQQAFLDMTHEGWNERHRCEDSSYKVIKMGEKFLKNHPDSLLLESVRLELAKAYETWWSLSKTVDKSLQSEHQKGSDAARRRALQLYKQYLKQCKECKGIELYELKETVFRLEQDIDTSHYWYLRFCP